MASCEMSVSIKLKWYAYPAIGLGFLAIRCGADEDKIIDLLARHCFAIKVA